MMRRLGSLRPLPFYPLLPPPLRLPRATPYPLPHPRATVATRSARQTGNEHFDQDRSSQLPMIASAEVSRWR